LVARFALWYENLVPRLFEHRINDPLPSAMPFTGQDAHAPGGLLLQLGRILFLAKIWR
jgi:hypothetical protein